LSASSSLAVRVPPTSTLFPYTTLFRSKICYESAFPEFMAGAIGADAPGKVIVILSQDSWFGRSRQPYQHLWQSALRAVENRVPVDRKSTRLNSSHVKISYAVFCLKKKK